MMWMGTHFSTRSPSVKCIHDSRDSGSLVSILALSRRTTLSGRKIKRQVRQRCATPIRIGLRRQPMPFLSPPCRPLRRRKGMARNLPGRRGRLYVTSSLHFFLSADGIGQMKEKTAGPGWFDLPAPNAAELPRLYREVEALRLRNQLDPKRFYKKDEGEGKGIKGLPKHFAVRFASSLPPSRCSFVDLHHFPRSVQLYLLLRPSEPKVVTISRGPRVNERLSTNWSMTPKRSDTQRKSS